MHVQQQGLDEIAGAGAAHLGAVLPTGLGRQQGQLQRGVQLGGLLLVQDLAAFDVQLAGDLQAIEVAFAVAHDLVGAIAVLVGMGRLPIAGMDVLGVPAHGPPEGEVGLKHLAGVADRPALGVHQPLGRRAGRSEAAVEQGVLGRQGADWRGDGTGRPNSRSRPAETRPCRRPGGAESAIVGVGPVHDPGGQLGMVQLGGDVVGQQAARSGTSWPRARTAPRRGRWRTTARVCAAPSTGTLPGTSRTARRRTRPAAPA